MTPLPAVSFDAEAVAILWPDGSACRYPYRYLRMQCACAACVEEMTGRKLLKVSSVPEDIIAVDFVPVGRYAFQFLWSDGHSTGIYPFDSLRKMSERDSAVACTQAG
jgi:DUF971 family protein